MDDQDRIDHEMVPAIIDGVQDLIIKRDKDTLLEGARGVGIFKSFQSVKSQQHVMTEMRVRIEVDSGPDGRKMEGVGANSFEDYGTPRVIEGEVKDGADQT
jgi:hypothetical protein